MDAKKLLVLETIAATLKVSQNELLDWVINRDQALNAISQLTSKEEIWGIEQLAEASHSLAVQAYKNSLNNSGHWSGH